MTTAFQQILVPPELPLEEAMRVLDKAGLRIVLVVDTNGRLLGTLTDGDIRRAMLRHMPLDAPVRLAMFDRPTTARADWSRERVMALMEQHGLLHVPVVDEGGQLRGLETLHGLLRSQHRDNPVFLMAGGFGKRLMPLTQDCPKPLLKVGDRPILELIVENFVAAGFHRFFISTHYRPEMIREQMGDGSRWGASIRYVHEDEPLGTGGALGLLPHEEIDLPLFMMNGDLLTNMRFEALLDFHQAHDGIATMGVREYEHRVPYGVIQTEGNRVVAMTEKPSFRHFINAGIYLLSPALVRSVPKGTAVDMPTLLEQHISAGESVHVYPIQEYWLDIGRMEDFQKAQVDVGSLW